MRMSVHSCGKSGCWDHRMSLVATVPNRWRAVRLLKVQVRRHQDGTS
jgi:hypothetical protein